LLSNWISASAGAPAIPLAMLGRGQSAVVLGVQGGRGIVRRLTDMGLTPGAQVTVISHAGSAGPVIVAVLGTKLMLGRGIAHKVMVRPL